MADEKLPDYIEEALGALVERASAPSFNDNLPVSEEVQQQRYDSNLAIAREDALLAIAKAISEREAAALERAAKVCEAVSFAEHSCATDAEHKAQRIRALIHKEPANG